MRHEHIRRLRPLQHKQNSFLSALADTTVRGGDAQTYPLTCFRLSVSLLYVYSQLWTVSAAIGHVQSTETA